MSLLDDAALFHQSAQDYVAAAVHNEQLLYAKAAPTQDLVTGNQIIAAQVEDLENKSVFYAVQVDAARVSDTLPANACTPFSDDALTNERWLIATRTLSNHARAKVKPSASDVVTRMMAFRGATNARLTACQAALALPQAIAAKDR